MADADGRGTKFDLSLYQMAEDVLNEVMQTSFPVVGVLAHKGFPTVGAALRWAYRNTALRLLAGRTFAGS
jgi:hypothetical protein